MLLPLPWLRTALCALVLLLGSGHAAPSSSQPTAVLPARVKRVLFLGDSITYGGAYAVEVETYFVTRQPARSIEFINAGLPSETVSGLSEPNHAGGAFPRPDVHERLARVLAQTQPDLVFACYGMNDGIYLPFDAARFAAFQSGLRRLRAAVLATGAAMVHLTPPVYVDVKGTAPAYAAVLDRQAEWLVQRRADGWDVVDVHAAMARELAARRRREPAFTFARDGVHPGDEGHWIIARETLRHLGARDLAPDADLSALTAPYPTGAALLKTIRSRAEVMKDAWLTSTGHTRPRMKAGLPLAEAHRQGTGFAQEIAALQTGAPAPRN